MTFTVPIPVAVAVLVLAFGAARVLFAAAAGSVGGAHCVCGRGKVVLEVTVRRIAVQGVCGAGSLHAARLWAASIGCMQSARRKAHLSAGRAAIHLRPWALRCEEMQGGSGRGPVFRIEGKQCAGRVW
jgi:hypothetical protein